MKNNRIIWIDFIRVLCTLYIIGFWHLDDYLISRIVVPLPIHNIPHQTTYCVLATFTLISGFFSASKHLTSKNEIIAFYKKKLLRIYPLFTLAGVLLVLTRYNGKGAFIKSQIGIGLFLPPFPITIWFICMLFIFYFITPFVLKRDNIKKSFILFLLLEIIFFSSSLIFGIDERLYYYWPFFYIGLMIKEKNYHTLIRKNYITTILSFILYLTTSITVGENFSILTFVCAISFIYTIANISYILFGKQHNNKIIEYISYSSMCAYLFHRPLYYCFQKIIGSFNLFIAFFVCLPTVIILSWLIQKTYDTIISYYANNNL